jgi:hypothetical protein
VVRSGVWCRRALLALVLARAGSPTTARADDLREAFGLRGPPATPALPGCGDGLAFHCAVATDPLDAATPYALSTWLPASYLTRLPVGDAAHDSVAWYALGASRDEAGPSFGGATGLENRWTIDGAPADNIRTGGADTRVPLAFLDGILVTAGGFSARDRASTGGTIDARLKRGTPHHEVTADVWSERTRAGRDRPIPSGNYAVRRLSFGATARATASVVATGPLGPRLGGRAWYAAGVAPSLSTTGLSWRAARVLDDDGDGVPDGLTGDVATAPIETTTTRTHDYLVPVMARVGLDRGPHHFELSVVGQLASDARFLANATLQAAGIARSDVIGDAIATWRGTWADTRARVQLSWHRSAHREAARDPAAAHQPQLLSAYVPTTLPEDPGLAAICDDTSPSDPTLRIANCPVPFGFFASGGAGQLTDTTSDRPSATLDLAHRAGDHVIRVGATVEDARQVTTSAFTGTEQVRSLFPGVVSRRRFTLGTCSDVVTERCDYASASQLTYRTLYAAAYAEDTFTPAPGLTVNLGLRWELMWVGTNLHFSRELSPRVGVVWDPLGDGRSRLWAHLGTTFALLPAGLGATVIQRDATANDLELGIGNSRTHDAGAAYRVVPGVAPIEQREVTVGGELALIGALRATLWGHARVLRRGLETTPDGFDNPGRNGDPPATRETELVAFALEMAARDRTRVRTGVMWGRTVGTWTGPFDPRQGSNLLQGPDWDADPSNLDGPLPTDLGTRAFMEAERRGSLGGVAVAAATRLTIGSGRPRNVLADGEAGIVELLPRGSAGRNPVVTQADLRLSARWQGFTATLDVINLFDRREVINVDEVYTSDSVRPIQGGRLADLALLNNAQGQPAARRTAYGLPIAFQPPLSISLGVHKTF